MTFFTELPPEMLALIAEQLADHEQTLQTLAMTCHQLQDVAETILYRDIFLRSGRQCISLIQNFNVRPQRAKAVQRIELRGLFQHEVGLQKFHKLLRLVPRLQELTYESPAANYGLWASDGNWRALVEPIKSLFQDLANYARPTSHPDILPLNALRRLTLHWHGVGWRHWAANEIFEGLFAHPHLEELTVSCATILDPLTLDRPQTPLRILALIECDISVSGLKAVLALPGALEHLDLGENRSHPETRGKTERILGGATDPDKFLEALSQQRHSLKSFRYRPRSEFYGDDSFVFSGNIGFSGFEQLQHVSLLCHSKAFETTLTSTSTAPPRLTTLKFAYSGHRAGKGAASTTIFEDISNDVALKDQETIVARSRLARLSKCASLLDSVQEVTFLGTYVFESEQDRDTFPKAFGQSAKILKSRKKRLVLLKEERRDNTPPYLYVDQEPRTAVLFETGPKGQSKNLSNGSAEEEPDSNNPDGPSPHSEGNGELVVENEWANESEVEAYDRMFD